MAELFPPAVARFTSDATPFIEGIAKANGATRDWQAELAKASTASQKAGTTAEAAANRAAVAMRRAADSAAALAKAQADAATASQKLAAGEIDEEAASKAAATASRAQTTALDAQARASVAAQRAAQTNADAQKAAAGVQTASAARTEAAWASVGAGANKAGKFATLALVGIGVESIKLAGNFQQQTNVLVTAAGELPKNLGFIRTGILDIASATGTAWQKVTESVYDAEKAGFRGKSSLQVANAASQAAREEGADLTIVTSGLTRALSAYNLTGNDAVRVTNALKTGAGEAHATFQDYASGLGSFLSRAAAAKISLPDALGVYSSLTQQLGAQQAGQNIGSTIQNLSNVKGPQVAEFGQLGIDVVDFEKKLGDGPGGRGLIGSLNLLSQTVLQKLGPSGTLLLNTFNQSQLAARDANTELQALPDSAQKVAKAYVNGSLSLKDYRTDLKGLSGPQASLVQQFVVTENKAKGFQAALRNGGPAAQTYLAALRLLVGGQEGLSTALAATGQNAAKTDDRVKRISDSFNTAGKNVQGWEITQKNFNVKFDQFKQQAERVGIQLGNDLIPKVEGLFNALSKHPGILKDIVKGLELMVGAWVAIKIGNLVVGLSTLATRLLGVSTAARAAATSTNALATAEVRAGGAGAAEGAGIAAGSALPAASAAAGVGTAGRFLLPAAGGGAGRALAAGLEKSALGRIAIPVGVTLVAINSAKALDGLVNDFKKHHYADGISKELNSQLVKGLTFGLSGGIAKALKSKDWVDAIPGAGLAKKFLGIGGGLTGTLTPDFGKATKDGTKYAENFWKAAADIGKIKDFSSSLGIFKNLIDTNSKSLTGNSQAAITNRAALELLASKAKDGAVAQYRLTGKQSDYNAAVRIGIGQIESEASALGFNKQQVDFLLAAWGLVPGDKSTTYTTPGVPAALVNLQLIKDALDRIPLQKQVDISVIQTGTAPDALIAQAAGGTGHGFGGGRSATGGPISGPGTGTSDSIPRWLSNGEYVIKAASVKQYGVGFFNALNAGRMASGGLVSPEEKALKYIASHKKVAAYFSALDARQSALSNQGASGLLSDLSILGNYTHGENQLLAYNKANFARAGRAQAPALQLAAQNAATVAHAVGSYFNAHKATLFRDAHSGSAAQRKAAGALYNELANFAHLTSSDALQEASLSSALRNRYASAEAHPLRFGAPSRDLSYLALAGAPTSSGPSHVTVTVVSQLDSKEIARSNAKVALSTESRNLSNGTTRVRNR